MFNTCFYKMMRTDSLIILRARQSSYEFNSMGKHSKYFFAKYRNDSSSHAFIHTYFHPFIHPYIHPYIHLSIRPSIHTCIHTSINPYIHPYFHTSISIHPSIHTFIHASIHTCIHPYIHREHCHATSDFFMVRLVVKSARTRKTSRSGILKQIGDEMSKSTAEETAAEEESKQQHAALSAAKSKEIAAHTKASSRYAPP